MAEENMNAASITIEPERWVDEYGDYLFRYAQSRLRDRDAAEEVVQQTFVAGFENRQQYAGKGSLRGWLMGILKRKIVDLYRQRSRTSALIEDSYESKYFDEQGSWKPDVRNSKHSPLDTIDREEFWEILQKCLGLLPKGQADAFVLRELDEKDSQEICKELEITPSNLWVSLHRARLQLTHCMKHRWQN